MRWVMGSRTRRLQGTWLAAVDRAVDGASEASVLYSGGLDSSLVVRSARDRCALRLVAIGTEGSFDLRQAESGARALEMEVDRTIIGEREIRVVLQGWKEDLTGIPEPSFSVTVAMILALQASPKGRILCGQGADELFLGYAHFRGLGPEEAVARRGSDLSRLLGSDWPRAVRIARRLGQDLRSPFVDPDLVDLVVAEDIADFLPVGARHKSILRALAEACSVPSALAARPKKALQYGSGVAAIVRSIRKGSPAPR
jgi:asparagine synthase (glutamine-hydrolysing)